MAYQDIIRASTSNEFFRNLPYDILAIGNHELYIRNNTLNMHGNFAPHFNGRYLSSNVNITIDGVSKHLGSRFAIFKMRKGRAVTALDVLFDFTGNDVHTTVQTVENMVKEAWFADAIKDERDVFLLAGHMPARWVEHVIAATTARTIAPPRTSPSVAGDLDPNRITFEARFLSNNSLLSLMAEVMPVALTVNNTCASVSNIIITNSGSLRFDIYAGPFTKNDQLTVSPFVDSFLHISNVPFSVANAVLPAHNGAGADNKKRDEVVEAELWARGYVGTRYRKWMENMARLDAELGGEACRAAANLTLGYVTTNACRGVGDDTPHAPLEFHAFPDFIASAAPTGISQTMH
ncbi:5'-nucleotidase [Mycena olivaceomarginata]|nr:5'-nucleotidase [Mycena olivaceomarginata]